MYFASKFSSFSSISEDDPQILFLYSSYVEEFCAKIEAFAGDPEVVGFKSIACYRGGLDVLPGVNNEAAFRIFANALRDFVNTPAKNGGKKTFRLDHGILNHTLLCRALQIAGKYSKPGSFSPGNLKYLHSPLSMKQSNSTQVSAISIYLSQNQALPTSNRSSEHTR